MDRYIFRPRPQADAALRLLCFAPAGHGAAIFRDWGRGLPPHIDVCAIRLPGRENIRMEPLITDFTRLIDLAVGIVEPYLDRPFAVFGHSMGAWLAFEVARRLAANGTTPLHLFVSGRQAPQVERHAQPIHDLPEPELIAEIQRRYNGIPQVLLNEPELLKLTLPILRADLAALAGHRCVAAAPLDCDLSCYAGVDDREIGEDELEAWRRQTTRRFTLQRFPGDHFYMSGRSAPALLSTIARSLPHVHEAARA
jgi:medium-chain acyl-[acyl-carrier-protein] hydrolase